MAAAVVAQTLVLLVAAGSFNPRRQFLKITY